MECGLRTGKKRFRHAANGPRRTRRDALISLAWLEDAAQRPTADHAGRLAAGLDVAGPGEDETVLVITEPERIVGLQAWADQDPRGAVVAALTPYRHRLDVVNVDAAGIGYYLAKHLQDLGYPVRPLNVRRWKGRPYAGG